MSSQIWAQSRRLRLTSVTGELRLSLLRAKKLSNWSIFVFPACERKKYANLFELMCAVAGHYRCSIWTFLQTPSSLCHSVPRPSKRRASGNSHLFAGPPNHAAVHEMSSFHHSEMQMNGATIISHPVIISYAFWKGRKCVVLSLSQHCLSLDKRMTYNTNAWKGSAAQTHCTPFFPTGFTRNLILLL